METELHAIPKGGRSIGGRSPENTAGEMGTAKSREWGACHQNHPVMDPKEC